MSSAKYLLLFFVLLLHRGYSQSLSCYTDQFSSQKQVLNPLWFHREAAFNEKLVNAQRDLPSQDNTSHSTFIVPVIFHILHDNGPENIPNQLVFEVLANLNDAFSNRNYFHDPKGVDTGIRFQMAKFEREGSVFNGIERIQTIHTHIQDYFHDVDVKALYSHEPEHFLNIFIVKQAPASGYAYLPHLHGDTADGIVITANTLGYEPKHTITLIHETGHYLGLYHTFEGGCKNLDCSVDGDRVCDTPPDFGQVVYEGCIDNNSCHSDLDDEGEHNPMTHDIADDNSNFMDYNQIECLKHFTEGQAQRMRSSLLHIRNSLFNNELAMANPDAGLTLNHGNCGEFNSSSLLIRNYGSHTINELEIVANFGNGIAELVKWKGEIEGFDSQEWTIPEYWLENSSEEKPVIISRNPNDIDDYRPENDTLNYFYPRLSGLNLSEKNPLPIEFWKLTGPMDKSWTSTVKNDWCPFTKDSSKIVEIEAEPVESTYFYFDSPPIYAEELIQGALNISWYYSQANIKTDEDPTLKVLLSFDCGYSWEDTLREIKLSDALNQITNNTCRNWQNSSINFNRKSDQSTLHIRLIVKSPSSPFKLGIKNMSLDAANPVTSKSDLISAQIKLFPNPAKEQLNIFISEGSQEDINYEIFDLNLKAIRRESIQKPDLDEKLTIPLRGISSGLYYIRIRTGNDEIIRKFSVIN